MAYDSNLATRIRNLMSHLPGLQEKKMFGGVGFLIGGNMACGVHKDDLIVRIGLEGYDQALQQPHVKLFDITGRPMKGWVMVEPPGVTSEAALRVWVERDTAFASSLPPK